MVQNGQRRGRAIPEIRHRPLGEEGVGAEVMDLRTLPARAGEAELAAVQRLAFHQLVALDRGSLWHTVDFTDYAVEPGQWLWVRPGQVQQWRDLRGVEGTLLIFEPGFLSAEVAEAGAVDDPFASAVWAPEGEDVTSLRLARDLLHDEFWRTDLPPHVRRMVVRSALSALVLRLTHIPRAASETAPASDVFLAFRDAVERGFAESRRVEDYAQALAYAPRTLSRATFDAAGVSAKAFIDRRVVLEAKRLLAHTDRPAGRIAGDLGFSSATNFTKFFVRGAGETPVSFRSRS